ncbi:hypothetical protein ACFT5B_08555 [Luteimicrobium sp. NPDC057192]|uniref:hypothetical protein n=1 Tax=Luteimicrobium sp. NPDC057192 TaxID=3346042 RepID=UPI003644236B
MSALVAYTVARCGRAQVWVAPWLTFVVAIALLDAPSGRAADALALSTVALLFVAAWLVIATLGSQAPEQSGVLAAAVGGARRERLGAQLAAAVGSAVVVPVSFLVAWAESRDPVHPASLAHGLSGTLVVTALLAHVVAVVCGTVVGAALARPLVTSRVVTLLVVLLVGVLLVVVPWAPVSVAVGRTAHPTAAGTAVMALAVAVVAVVGVAVAWWTAGLAARRG